MPTAVQTRVHSSARERVLCALAALLMVAGGVLALVFGLAFTPGAPRRTQQLEAIFPTRPAPRPPIEEPAPPPPRDAAGGAPPGLPAPAGRKADPAQVVLPPPRLPPLITPPQVPVAPVAGTGSATRAGAADRDGAGQGAGGTGNGTGGGGMGGNGGARAGDGSADGNGNAAVYPRQTAGKLHYAEIPKELRKARAGGVIRLRYRIGTDGRASGCSVIISSGLPDFDRGTCARITERFRFRPARDAAGNPVPFVMTETHGWDAAPGDD